MVYKIIKSLYLFFLLQFSLLNALSLRSFFKDNTKKFLLKDVDKFFEQQQIIYMINRDIQRFEEDTKRCLKKSSKRQRKKSEMTENLLSLEEEVEVSEIKKKLDALSLERKKLFDYIYNEHLYDVSIKEYENQKKANDERVKKIERYILNPESTLSEEYMKRSTYRIVLGQKYYSLTRHSSKEFLSEKKEISVKQKQLEEKISSFKTARQSILKDKKNIIKKLKEMQQDNTDQDFDEITDFLDIFSKNMSFLHNKNSNLNLQSVQIQKLSEYMQENLLKTADKVMSLINVFLTNKHFSSDISRDIVTCIIHWFFMRGIYTQSQYSQNESEKHCLTSINHNDFFDYLKAFLRSKDFLNQFCSSNLATVGCDVFMKLFPCSRKLCHDCWRNRVAYSFVEAIPALFQGIRSGMMVLCISKKRVFNIINIQEIDRRGNEYMVKFVCPQSTSKQEKMMTYADLFDSKMKILFYPSLSKKSESEVFLDFKDIVLKKAS